MKKLFVTIALSAAAISLPALAQGGGWMQRDETRQQAQQMADMMFQKIDANHDGVVTRDEAQQAAARFGEDAKGGRVQHMIEHMFGDGQSLTLAQFEARALAHFDAMDLNHDGIVTPAERQQARELHSRTQPQAQPSAQPQARQQHQ